MFRFTQEDLEPYIDGTIKAPWGPIGQVVYNRTYSRPIYNEQQTEIVDRESWLETCIRVIEGNMNLVPNDPTATPEWAKEAMFLMYTMAWLPPGRGLWMMGTEYAENKGGDALNNCWYISVVPDLYENEEIFQQCQGFSNMDKAMPSFPFVFMFDRAMLGGGVGFGASRENMRHFPRVTRKANIYVILNKTHADYERIHEQQYEHITLMTSEGIDGIKATVPTRAITIEDSREGWSTAIRETIDSHFFPSQYDVNFGKCPEEVTLVLDFNKIRGYGTEIKGFGGTASGPEALIQAIDAINKVINSRYNKFLVSTDALDIMNLLGRCVVAGNVRRTALIAIGDADDKSYVEAKDYTKILPLLELSESGEPIWVQDEHGNFTQKRKPYELLIEELGQAEADELISLAWKQENHRWASNNSVYTDDKFTDFGAITDSILANGEPGICNMDLSRNFGRIIDGRQENIDEDVDGFNPCAEITLANGENCNLVEFNPLICEQYNVPIERAIEIATQYAYRITFAPYLWEVTTRTVNKNRRIGVSIGGIQDYWLHKYGNYAVSGYRDAAKTDPIYDERIVEELDRWYKLVKKTNEEHARLMGANPSIKVTTMKPSGTISKLTGLNAGVHLHYSPFLIQRIRFHETDSNLEAMKLAGFPIEPDFKTPNTMVVEFPIKSPNAEHENFQSSESTSIEEQFATQALFAKYWADNAVSATVTFKEEERDLVQPMLEAYSGVLKSTSLLPYSGHGYTQAPWEPIDEQEYERRVAELKMTVAEAYKLISLIGETDIIDDITCAGGSCPIK